MQLGRKLRRFLDMKGADRLLNLEAAAFLALMRVALLVIPFHHLTKALERMPESPTCAKTTVVAVRRAIEMAARNVPWNAVCLPQAMAAKAMLARRGCGSALHLGAVKRDGEGLTAHAWLVAGGEVVVGEAGVADAAPLARFG